MRQLGLVKRARAAGVPWRMIALDVAAATGFAALPQVSVMRPVNSGVSSTWLWALPIAVALPLCVRHLWPLPAFVATIAISVIALPLGLAPTCLLAAAYAAYPVASTQRRPPGRSAAIVGGVSVAGSRPDADGQQERSRRN